MTDIGQWYKQLPRFTRLWLSASIGFSLLGRFGILPPSLLYLSPDLIFRKYEIWRLITSLFTYPLTPGTGFHFLINCYFIVQYSARLEREQFSRTPADYLYLLLIVSVLSLCGGLFFYFSYIMDLLVVAVTYIWCHLNKDVIVTFWFGTNFKAMYLPWVLAAMELVFQGHFASLLGILIGHFYYFLKFQYPQELGGKSFLETPNFLKNFVPDLTGGVTGFGMPPASRAPLRPPTGGSGPFGGSWGRGNSLGR